jgi:Transposase DDE domain
MFVSLTEIFCQIDDFCNNFDANLQHFFLTGPTKKRRKACAISLSEIMTIVILFHMSGYRTFKDFYLLCVCRELRPYFPKLLSYSRFVQVMEYALMPLTVFLNGIKGKETGIYYADSTPIAVCHIRREKRHKVFKGLATKGKSSMGWFFGFKLHLVINNLGEIMACTLTKANTDDRKPVPTLVNMLEGWLFADKGYLGKEFWEKLKAQSIELFTKVKKNMQKKIMAPIHSFYLSKRGLIETVNDQLKNICQIEHTRHRKPANAFVNLVSGLIAYAFKPRKPSIKNDKLRKPMVALTSS